MANALLYRSVRVIDKIQLFFILLVVLEIFCTYQRSNQFFLLLKQKEYQQQPSYSSSSIDKKKKKNNNNNKNDDNKERNVNNKVVLLSRDNNADTRATTASFVSTSTVERTDYNHDYVITKPTTKTANIEKVGIIKNANSSAISSVMNTTMVSKITNLSSKNRPLSKSTNNLTTTPEVLPAATPTTIVVNDYTNEIFHDVLSSSAVLPKDEKDIDNFILMLHHTTNNGTIMSNNNNNNYNDYDYLNKIVPLKDRIWLEMKRRSKPVVSPTNNDNKKKLDIIKKLGPSLPIFVLNLPKSGTRTIYDYFKCGLGSKHYVGHYWIKRHSSKMGKCFATNVWNQKPMAYGCGGYYPNNNNNNSITTMKHSSAKMTGGYAVFTDMGLMWTDDEADVIVDDNISNIITNNDNNNGTITTKKHNNNNKNKQKFKRCFYPGVHGLNNIAKYYPNSTILHFPRTDTKAWVESSYKLNHLLNRYDTFCGGFRSMNSNNSKNNNNNGVFDVVPNATTKQEWMQWYANKYTTNVRDFVKANPSLTYLEHPLEDIVGASKYLETHTGIPSSCYKHTHKTKTKRN